LWYVLSHACGAAFFNPGLIVAAVVGDGESETGPLATSWHISKFLSPNRDGAVLPILHLNGYKIIWRVALGPDALKIVAWPPRDGEKNRRLFPTRCRASNSRVRALVTRTEEGRVSWKSAGSFLKTLPTKKKRIEPMKNLTGKG
jgi:hypothetical protein